MGAKRAKETIRRYGFRIGSGAILAGLAAAAVATALGVLEDRRARLLRRTELELAASAEALASLVNDRGRAIRNDMILACEVRQHAARNLRLKLEIIRSHLIALNTSAKHYLRLWYFEDGEVATEVSGFRAGEPPAPQIPAAELEEIERRARATPGTIVSMQAVVPIESPYDSLRLLAIATKADDTLAVLVNMDGVFDALQRRASLPGLDLWVVDGDGSVLVDPGSPRDVLPVLLGGVKNGTRILGSEPSVWPFSDRGKTSQMLAWRTVQGQPLPWITAVAGQLDDVTTSMHELSVKILLVCSVALMLVAGVSALLFGLARRQEELKQRVRALSTIDELREQLLHLEKLSTLGQVAAGLAHEMGTPLGVISIRIEQLLEQIEDERHRNALGIMKAQIERIDRIMRHVLKSSRPTTAQLGEVSVRQVVSQVAELVQHRFESKRVALEVSLSEDVSLWASADQMQQVLLNLLVNANDACEAGDQVVIKLAPKPDAKGRRGLVVEDTGPGIAPEDLPQVFEPFFTTKRPGEGTGLGLSIVREIMQRHRGEVEIVSNSEGTRVTTWWRTEVPQGEAFGVGESIDASATEAQETA